MEDVTDAAFRRLIARVGKPDVMYCEFTSADGLVFADEAGRTKLLKKLEYDDSERPVVAQLFSASPERMEKGAAIAAARGFDGIDINMGCPDRSVEKSGCGSALIKNPALARELLRAAKRGAAGVPVSVKTRIGYADNELRTWLPELLAEEPAAVALHARTRNELSLVPARWEHVAEAVEIRDALGSSALIIGNGDAQSVDDARERCAGAGCDGAMLGRAIYGNPWLYARRTSAPTPRERMEALAEHVRLFEEIMGQTTNYAVMKKHFKAYVHGWQAGDGLQSAKDIRMRLMETAAPSEARAILADAILPA
ncbi:hypothetical protein COU20_03365 [Candidatus Kaiserbacteria bacterium CG10_big_fil_rev_8_21_14_0_10_59_10]|uniref:tRNA-dihydrouridine synthase n=1 Tax=Candidatus Kaiserbacteria bacterium CG10_big_fil_rev_8_21_14_0_10_59_10 TaxID=1974612 RepID=A0A2H0U6W7_9BACT|nr:MAG: hypothetical protein COU20_03365 [Candidatus Kaiserbacteria bacterium CG10_big_fil_rev_8_21_14_0_10_59_10]